MCGRCTGLRSIIEKCANAFGSRMIIMTIDARHRSNRHRMLDARMAVIACCALLLSICSTVSANENTLQLAVIGPLSGKDRAAGQAMLDGVRLRIAQINRQGGIGGKKLHVLAYDDQNSKEIARQKALEIAKDSNALVVIGHYYSSTSVEGGKIFRQFGIPAITANATAPAVTEANDWYFRVVPDTNLQGKYAAIYTRKILKQDNVRVVYEQDAYGSALQQAFVRSADKLGLKVENVWTVNSAADDGVQLFKAIVHQLQGDPNPGALFVALQDHEAAALVRRIRDAGIAPMIVGGDAIGSDSFLNQFDASPRIERGVGHYTDGIYTTTLFIRDIGNFQAQQFIQAFTRHYGHAPDDTSAINYDAAAIAIEAIKRATLEKDVVRNRARIRDQLKAFNLPEAAHKGVTGRIYFDEHGNVIKPLPFGVYSHGRMISAPFQLSPIIDPQTRVDYQKDLKEGHILVVDGQSMYKTTVVYTGLDVTEINNIDPRKGTFRADFYLWFRSVGPLDYSNIEFYNATEPIRLDDALMEMTGKNAFYRAFRINSDFKAAFHFKDYPFDTQTLSTRFRHKKLDSERLLFVADDIGMQREKGEISVEGSREYASLDPAGEWQLKDVLIFSDMGFTESTLGNPHMFHANADTDISYSRFNVNIKIERKAKSYVLKNLIPLFIIILIGYAMLFVTIQGPPFVARMNLGITALLSAIFLSINAAGQLPNIGYLVALDYIYIATYVLIMSGIIITIAELIATRRSKNILAKRLEVFGRIFQPIFFVSTLGFFVYLYS
jgi:ABC-type branched-subunit amino acid transport system substrate-binding protein